MGILVNFLYIFIFLFVTSVQAFPIPKNNKVIFDIIRKNNVIGSHEIVFSEKDGYIYIETNIDIKVKIFFVTAYEFFHQSKEVWENGNFIKINAHSNFEDEREYFIEGEVKNDVFFANGMDGELILDKNLIPSNFWNQDVMYQQKIFDTQKGIVRTLDVKEIGMETIKIQNKKIDCLKFTLNASKHLKDKEDFPEYTLWYSENKELIKFKFKSTKDNKIIEIIRKL